VIYHPLQVQQKGGRNVAFGCGDSSFTWTPYLHPSLHSHIIHKSMYTSFFISQLQSIYNNQSININLENEENEVLYLVVSCVVLFSSYPENPLRQMPMRPISMALWRLERLESQFRIPYYNEYRQHRCHVIPKSVTSSR
jgi:hypothetical protein